jgi:hypothetical protein
MSAPPLTSWKEIAAFLRIDVKTAQRWERTRGLPVRRPPGAQRGLVYASREEIEEWLSRSAKAGPDAGGGVKEPAPPRPRRAWAWAAAAVLAISLGIYARLAARPAAADYVALEGRVLTGFSPQGETLWRFQFPEFPVLPHLESEWTNWLHPVRWEARGPKDFIAVTRFHKAGVDTFRIWCFGADGRLRWSWDPGIDLPDFDGRPFEPVWAIHAVAVDDTGGAGRVWAAVTNPRRWASALYRLDRDGKAQLHFGNAGHILEILRLPARHGSRLLIAGVNNAFSQPFLAEIPADGPPGFSPPSEGPRYRFAESLPGVAKRYILLPKSELHSVGRMPYFHVRDFISQDEDVFLDTVDLASNKTAFSYQFTPDLTPVRVRVTATGAGIHQHYEAAGSLRHTQAECPEFNQPHRLRIWEPGRGWFAADVPVSSAVNAH